MGRKTFSVVCALVTLVAFTASTVEARHGSGAGANCNQVQKVGKAGCRSVTHRAAACP
jgi:hypothetical protein